MKFSIVTTTYNDYELLRQLVESVLNNVDPDSYKEIIVMDDYSKKDGRLRAYEEYLNANNPKVRVILHDEYRYSHLYQYKLFMDKVTNKEFDYQKLDSLEPNMGHPYALNEVMKYVETDYVFEADCDCVFLSKAGSMLFEMEKLFDENEKVLGIGQVAGEKIHEKKIFDKNFIWKSRGRNAGSGGYVSQCASALRTSAWKEHEIYVVPPRHFKHIDEKVTASALNFFHEYLYIKGFQTMNYPVFSEGNMIHLGGGFVKRSPGGRYVFGFCRDFPAPYGPRRDVHKLESWHMGRYYIDMKYNDYIKELKEKYENPFAEIQPSLDETKLKSLD